MWLIFAPAMVMIPPTNTSRGAEETRVCLQRWCRMVDGVAVAWMVPPRLGPSADLARWLRWVISEVAQTVLEKVPTCCSSEVLTTCCSWTWLFQLCVTFGQQLPPGPRLQACAASAATAIDGVSHRLTHTFVLDALGLCPCSHHG